MSLRGAVDLEWLELGKSMQLEPHMRFNLKKMESAIEKGIRSAIGIAVYVGNDFSDLFDGITPIFLRFPYYSIVLPMTATSAFLLLSKPRQSTPKKTPETIPQEGC